MDWAFSSVIDSDPEKEILFLSMEIILMPWWRLYMNGIENLNSIL